MIYSSGRIVPSGRNFSARAAAFGYSAAAENIAAGSNSASALFCQWRNSPGHNTNVLGGSYTSTGIGEASGSGRYGIYWSSNFGGSVNDTLLMTRLPNLLQQPPTV